MGAQKHEAVRNPVPFGSLVHVGAGVVGEGSAYLGYVPFELLGKVGGHKIGERVQIPLADRLRNLVGDGLVLFRRYGFFSSPRFPGWSTLSYLGMMPPTIPRRTAQQMLAVSCEDEPQPSKLDIPNPGNTIT